MKPDNCGSLEPAMIPDRRQILTLTGSMALGTATAVVGPRLAAAQTQPQSKTLSVTDFGVDPSSPSDQTKKIQDAIDLTSQRSQSLYFPSGDYIVGQLKLGGFSHLIGEGRSSRLLGSGPEALMVASSADDILLHSLGFFRDGRQRRKQGEALIFIKNTPHLRISNCHFENSFSDGMKIRECVGQIQDNVFINNAGTALSSEDSRSLDIFHNTVQDCGGGIRIRRRRRDNDGTFITNNRIERISINSENNGTGTGIELYRTNDVIISGNQVTDCGRSAIHASEVSNLQLVGNSFLRSIEEGIKVTADFEGVIVANNMVDGASTGISLSNRKEGGRLSIVQGNIVRNLSRLKGQQGVGIAVETDCSVNSNIVENIPFAGILLGWGRHLRDATVSNNVIRNTDIGIGVSIDSEAGYATIMNNMISGAKKGAVRAMDLGKPIGPDLSQQSAEAFRNIAAFGNVSL